VVLLDGRGQGAGYADAVAAHNHVLLLSVLIEIGAVHGLGVLGAELEDMADLNALGELKPASAVRADITFLGEAQIVEIRDFAVAEEIHVLKMFVLFVGAHHVVGAAHELAVGVDRDGEPDGAGEAEGRTRGGPDHFFIGQIHHLGAEHILHLDVVDLTVAAHKNGHGLAVHVENHGLDHLLHGDPEEAGHVGHSVGAGRCHLFHGRAAGGILLSLPDDLAALDVGGVAAGGAGGDGIFPGFGQHVELVGELAADGAGVSAHCSINQTQAIKDAAVSFEHLVVALAGVFSRTVKRVSVFHDKVAAAHHAETRTTFVTELCLNLVEVHRELTPGLDFLTSDVGHDFFAGRLKNKVSVVSIFKAKQFRAVLLPAAGFLPKLSRLDDRHQKFDGAGTVHFFSDNTFNLLQRAKAHRHVVIDAGCKLTDHACAKHQLLANDFCICRSFFLC